MGAALALRIGKSRAEAAKLKTINLGSAAAEHTVTRDIRVHGLLDLRAAFPFYEPDGGTRHEVFP